MPHLPIFPFAILLLLFVAAPFNAARADECSETERVGTRLHDLILDEIRRHAEGGDIEVTASGRICFRNNPKPIRLSLTNTTRVGESAYKLVANRIVPIQRCFP